MPAFARKQTALLLSYREIKKKNHLSCTEDHGIHVALYKRHHPSISGIWYCCLGQLRPIDVVLPAGNGSKTNSQVVRVLHPYHNTSSVGDIIKQLDWPSLLARREYSSCQKVNILKTCFFFYKIDNPLVEFNITDCITPITRASRTVN